MPTVNDLIIEIEKIADPKYAYEWDNCGLCAGDKKSIVKKVLITLDITKDVVIEAIDKGCQMIISHHPLIFKPVLTVNTDTYVGEVLSLLYKNNIALYCAHTSLDIAVNGVNEALCKKLQLKNVSLLAPFIIDGTKISCARTGEIEKPLNKNQLIQYVKEKIGAKVLNYNLENKMYKKIALSTGAGEDFAFDITDEDVFITGEIKYHTALELKRKNISFIVAGHYYTEIHYIEDFMACLQKAVNVLQYNVTFLKSETNTNPFEN